VENVTPKSENFHPRQTTFTYHSEWDSHILQWKTSRSPQRVRTFTHVSPTTVRLSPANPNFHSPHWKLSPNTVITLTRQSSQSENSHPAECELSLSMRKTISTPVDGWAGLKKINVFGPRAVNGLDVVGYGRSWPEKSRTVPSLFQIFSNVMGYRKQRCVTGNTVITESK